MRAIIVLLLSVAVLGAWFYPASAQAQVYQCGTFGSTVPPQSCDEGKAFLECKQALSFHQTNYPNLPVTKACVAYTAPQWKAFECRYSGGACFSGASSYSYYAYPTTNLCVNRPDGNAGLINGTQYTGGVCKDGCKMVPNFNVGADDFSVADRNNSNAVNFKRGTWIPTGETCAVSAMMPEQPSEQKQACHTTSSGHQVCRGEGRTCVTAPSGFKACSADNAAGDISPVVQANNPRTEATSISAPNTAPSAPANREGENWQQGSGGATVTNNNTGNTSNISDYNNAGTPNGNTPVPGDGSGNSDDEGNEEQPGSVSGGGNCASPPAISGGDPVANYSATLAWQIRCGGEASETALTEAQGRIAEMDQCVLNGVCDDEGDDGPGPEYDPKHPADNPELLGSFRDIKDLDDINLDDSGFLGGGQCPQLGNFTVGAATIPLSMGPLCSILMNISGFVMAVAYLVSFRIIAGGLGGSA